MNDEKYILTLEISNERGSVRTKYEGVSRESLFKDKKTRALLLLHDSSIEQEEPDESGAQ